LVAPVEGRETPTSAGRDQLSTERDQLSTETTRTEELSTQESSPESRSTEAPKAEVSPQHETEGSQETQPTLPIREGELPSGLGDLNDEARQLLLEVPADREATSAWFKAVACNEDIAVYLVRSMGGRIEALDQPFPCLLHQDCLVTLTRGRNGE